MAGLTLTPIRRRPWLLAVAVAVVFLASFAEAGQQILIPLAPGPAIPGAFGTSWKTELWVYNSGTTQAAVSVRPALAGQGFVIPPKKSMEFSSFDAAAAGRGLLVEVADTADIRLQLQVREIAYGEMAGVTVPTVPLAGFSAEPQQLLNIPATSAFRTTVRIYALFSSGAPAEFTVRIYDMDHDDALVQVQHVTVPASPTLPPSYVDTPVGVAVLGDYFRSLKEIPHARLEIAAESSSSASRFWAFATVTHNVTQQVLIIVP